MSSSHRASLPLAPRTSSGGLCFRTDADGRIPLTRDWSALLEAFTRLDRPVLQVRHGCARLITIGDFPHLLLGPARRVARDITGSLRLELHRWHQAYGRLTACACCGSPARIDLHDHEGAAFLQLCARGDDTLADWATCFHTCASPLNAGLSAPPYARPSPALARLPADALTLPPDLDALPAFLAALHDRELPFTVGLHAFAASHTRELQPDRLRCEAGILTVGDTMTTAQIALPAVTGLALQNTGARHTLHLCGRDHTSLLALSAPSSPVLASRWNDFLRTHFATA